MIRKLVCYPALHVSFSVTDAMLMLIVFITATDSVDMREYYLSSLIEFYQPYSTLVRCTLTPCLIANQTLSP